MVGANLDPLQKYTDLFLDDVDVHLTGPETRNLLQRRSSYDFKSKPNFRGIHR